ncbi:MAG: hypothetical protein ACFE9L_02670 [Candidatus Hodarchaeota archaeon]
MGRSEDEYIMKICTLGQPEGLNIDLIYTLNSIYPQKREDFRGSGVWNTQGIEVLVKKIQVDK